MPPGFSEVWVKVQVLHLVDHGEGGSYLSLLPVGLGVLGPLDLELTPLGLH